MEKAVIIGQMLLALGYFNRCYHDKIINLILVVFHIKRHKLTQIIEKNSLKSFI